MKQLVIHAIPEGMVAVLRHTVHGLLLAELTERQPVICWGDRFLYRRDGVKGSAFLRFFEDRGYCDTNSVVGTVGRFLPSAWNAASVCNDILISYRNDETRPDVVQPPIETLLSSDADVIVYTHWNHLVDLLPFIPESSEYYGKDDTAVAGMIFRKYFKICDEILAPAKALLDSVKPSGRLIGVHCRGSDKITEHALVTPEDYRRQLGKVLKDDDWVVLATDSSQAAEKFRRWFGDRLILSGAERSNGNQGVHFTASDREKAGRDLLVDAYLLSRCAVHFGNSGSHVSYLVQAMLRDSGVPYDNFVNVKASWVAHFKRLMFYQLPGYGRRKIGQMLRGLGLLRGKS